NRHHPDADVIAHAPPPRDPSTRDPSTTCPHLAYSPQEGAPPCGNSAPQPFRLRAVPRFMPWPRVIGTPGSNLARPMTRLVLTLATLGAAVRSFLTKSWNVERSGATHFRMKSVSPESM